MKFNRKSHKIKHQYYYLVINQKMKINKIINYKKMSLNSKKNLKYNKIK